MSRLLYYIATAILAIMVTVSVVLIAYLFTNKTYTINRVISDSMYGTIEVGDTVFVKKCSIIDVTTGDIIEFTQNNDKHLVHRVIGISNSELWTKGDNSKYKDSSIVTSENFVGKVVVIYGRESQIKLFIIQVVILVGYMIARYNYRKVGKNSWCFIIWPQKIVWNLF